MNEWYRCSGAGPDFEELAICDVLADSHELAARAYAEQALADSLGAGDIDVRVHRLDDDADPGQDFELHVWFMPRSRLRRADASR